MGATRVVCAAISLTSGIGFAALFHALVAEFLTFVVRNGERVFRCVRLLPIAAKACVDKAILYLLSAITQDNARELAELTGSQSFFVGVFDAPGICKQSKGQVLF